MTATTLDPRAAYRLLARDYDAQPNALISLEERTAVRWLPNLAGKTAVDAAAGTGRWARICGGLGARVTALDFSAEMLIQGPRPAVLADLNHLPVANDTADLTVCAFAIGYAPESIRELHRVTRPGGLILVTDMHPDAAARGWTRSFRTAHGTVHVENHRYTIEELQVPGLKPVHLAEPHFGEEERIIFEQCGHGARFEEASRHPAIFAALWIKDA